MDWKARQVRSSRHWSEALAPAQSNHNLLFAWISHGELFQMTTKLLLNTTSVLALLFASWFAPAAIGEDRDLIGHWKLAGDAKDSSGHGNDGQNHGVNLS